MATFTSVQYVDPFAPLPLGSSQAGVQATLTGPPPSTVAYAQLLANQLPIGYGRGSTGTAVRVLNTMPLAQGVAYQLQVQFGAPGQDPANLDWSNPAAIISAPVVVQQAQVTAVTVTGSGFSASWDFPAGTAIAGAFLQLVDLTGSTVTSSYYLGTVKNATVSATYVAGHDYGVRITAVQPINGGTTGNFAPPYTTGPPTNPAPIPTTPPAVTGATCTGAGLTATWSAAAVPAGAAPPEYDIVLLNAGAVVAADAGGPTGGRLVTDRLTSLASPQVAARTRYGNALGAVGPPIPLFSLAPQIQSATITGTGTATITAQLSSPGALPAGGVLLATLYTDGVAGPTQTLDSASGTVTWTDVTVAADTSYAIDVALQVTGGGVVSLGVAAPRLALPLSAPSGLTASYDGQLVTITLVPSPGVQPEGYQVDLSGSSGGSAKVQAGPQLPISFAVNLDVSQTWTGTVTPVLGSVTARAGSSPISLPTIAAPTLTGVAYDGSQLSLQWSAAKLPYLSGYQVTVSNGPSLVVGSEQTNCVLPLTIGQASGATVTVTGLSPLRNTTASGPVPIVTSTIEVTSVTVGSTVVASWTATPNPDAVRAVLLLGGSVVRELPNATGTGVTFAAPTPAGQPYTLLVYPTSADNVAVGPAASPVELILTRPAIESGELSPDGQMSLRWSPGNTFGVTSYQVTATPTTGQPASLQVTGTSYQGPVPAAFAAPGTLAITPVNARCSGPAATAAVAAATTVNSVSYGGGQLVVTAHLAAPGGTDTTWLDVLVNGAVVARQVLDGPAAGPFTVPVAPPVGVSAQVRLTTVGPAKLAPSSAPVTVPTVVPTVTGAAYDGSQLHVSWLPTGEPGITGYVVSVPGTSLADTYVAGATVTGTALTVSLAYPFPTGVSVTVRAAVGALGTTGHTTGQASSGLPPSLAGNLYSAAVSQPGYPPYLYRRGIYSTLAAVTGQPIVVYLAKPFSGVDNPTVPQTATPVFQLAPSPAGSPLPYMLTLSSAVWTTLGADPVRSGLRDSYNQFLTQVETTGVLPWAVNLLRQLIAESMPQTFEEVLFYRYGYWRGPGLLVTDLTPGTRLQLSNALYQSVVGGVSQKNGFVALGNETLEIVDAIPQAGAGTLPAGPGRILSVDAFLSLLYPGSGSTQPGNPVAAGPIDFFGSGNRQSFYRLFYPPAFPPSGSTGSTAPTDNVALIGTASWSLLDTITSQYATTGTFPTGMQYFVTYFRGRSGLTPLVNVSIQGESRWSTLGTSVRQALTSVGLAPYWGGSGGDLVDLRRPAANLFTYPTPDAGLALDAVDLTGADLDGQTPLYWPLDMPLIGGDRLSVQPPNLTVP